MRDKMRRLLALVRLAFSGFTVWGPGFAAGVGVMCAGLRAQEHAWGHVIVNVLFTVFFIGLAVRNFREATEAWKGDHRGYDDVG